MYPPIWKYYLPLSKLQSTQFWRNIPIRTHWEAVKTNYCSKAAMQFDFGDILHWNTVQKEFKISFMKIDKKTKTKWMILTLFLWVN